MASSSDGREELIPVRVPWPLVRDWRCAGHLALALIGIGLGALLVREATQRPASFLLVAAFVCFGTAALALMDEHLAEVPAQVRKKLRFVHPMRWRWIAAAALLGAGVTWQAPKVRGPADLLVLVWVASLLAFLSALVPPRKAAERGRLWVRPAAWLPVLIALLALWWRWEGLAEAPWPVATPEAATALTSVRLLAGELSPFGGVPTNTAGMLAYWHSLGLRLLGDGLWGARAVSAVAGVGSVLLLFGLADELESRTATLAAALVLAGMAVHIHYSRVALENALLLLFGTAACWGAVRGTRTAQAVWWGLAGICLGMGLALSALGWWAVVLVIWWVLLTACLAPDEWRGQGLHLLWLLAGGGLTTAPFIAAGGLPMWPHQIVPGLVELSKWTQGEMAGLALVVRQTRDAFLGWQAYGDQSQLYGVSGPLLDVMSRIWLLAGLGVMAARGIERRALWLGGWLVVVAIADGLTLHAPASDVLLLGTPAVALLVAIGCERVWQIVFQGQPRPERELLTVAFVALSVALVVLLNVTFYLNTYLRQPFYATREAEVAAEVARLTRLHQEAYVYLYGGPSVSLHHPIIRLLVPHVDGEDGTLPPTSLPADRPVIVVWLPDQSAAIEYFMEHYTGIRLQPKTGRDGSLLFFWALLEPGRVAPRQR